MSRKKALYGDFNTDRRKDKWRNTVVLNKCKKHRRSNVDCVEIQMRYPNT